jgi:hypothetical protein
MGGEKLQQITLYNRTKTPVKMRATFEPLQNKYTLKKVYIELLAQTFII